MRAGAMRHIIDIYEVTRVKNDYGEREDSWSKVNTIRAQVSKTGGSVGTNAGEVFNTMTLKIEVWNHYDITEKNRIKWKGNMYSVDFIDPSYDDLKQTLQCNRVNE